MGDTLTARISPESWQAVLSSKNPAEELRRRIIDEQVQRARIDPADADGLRERL